jgi:N-acylneuraminate cytidylyltransferase
VERWATTLKVDFLRQGVHGDSKLAAALEICKALDITLREVAYMGDDRNCVELLSSVGFAACPADACKEVLAIEGIHVADRRGGDAAVRSVVEKWLLD